MENFMKTQGYNVLIIPEDIQKDEQKALKKAQREQIIAEGKDVAQKILEEQAAKAIEWLKDKEHQELVIKYGKLIAQAVITKKFLRNKGLINENGEIESGHDY